MIGLFSLCSFVCSCVCVFARICSTHFHSVVPFFSLCANAHVSCIFIRVSMWVLRSTWPISFFSMHIFTLSKVDELLNRHTTCWKKVNIGQIDFHDAKRTARNLQYSIDAHDRSLKMRHLRNEQQSNSSTKCISKFVHRSFIYFDQIDVNVCE